MLENPYVLGFLGNLIIAIVIISLVFLAQVMKGKVMSQMDKLVAFSVGLIISVVFLGFIPEVITHGGIPAKTVGALVLLGIFIFYVLELFLHWHHCKDLHDDGHSHHDHSHKKSPLIGVGTFCDNAIHGVVLFSAFSVDIHFGIATTLAILLHAIPQNIANLIMNHNNTKYVYLAAFGGIFGAILVYPFQHILLEYSFHILAIISGALLYTAMSDILPSFKKNGQVLYNLLYLLCMLLGVVAFLLLQPGEHDHGHEQRSEHHEEHADHDAFDHEMHDFEERHGLNDHE